MTPQQKRLYDIIKAELDATGVCPSYEEMRVRMGLKSKSGIHRLVCQLDERGYIRRLPHRDRSIEIIAPAFIPPSDFEPSADAILAEMEAIDGLVHAARKIKTLPWRKAKTVAVSKESYQALRKALAKLGAI